MRRILKKAGSLKLIAGLLVAFVSVDSAHAQSNTCIGLERQLASVSSGNRGGSSRKIRQYDRAIKEQRRQMQKTRRIAARAGCNPNSRLGIGRCGKYSKSLRQMQSNLGSLTNTRNSLRGGGNASAKRKSILRKMNRLGCGRDNIRNASVEPNRNKRRSLVEQIFGSRTYGEDGTNSGDEFTTGLRRGGKYRTMCVRTCDGYYFPISFSTVQQLFEYDEQICRSMCPGTETALYIHSTQSQAAEQMISYRTDQPYAKESFAFNYRKSLNNECSCKFSQAALQELAGDAGQTETKADEARSTHGAIGTPVFRPDLNQDLETERNLAGGLTLKALENLNATKPTKDDRVANLADKIENNEIRIVGPVFFPFQ